MHKYIHQYIHLMYFTFTLLYIHKNKTPKPPKTMNMKNSEPPFLI